MARLIFLLAACCLNRDLDPIHTHVRADECFSANHGGMLNTIVISQDERLLATVGGGSGLRVWSIADHKMIYDHKYRGFFAGLAACFSPDQKTLFFNVGPTVFSLDINKKRSRLFFENRAIVSSIVVCRKEHSLLMGDHDGQIQCVDMMSGKLRWSVATDSPIWDLALSPDGGNFAFITESGTLGIGDFSKKTITVTKKKESSILRATFSPRDDKKVAFTADSDLYLFGQATRGSHRLNGHDLPVSSISFCATGKLLASASDDGKVKIWDVSTRACIRSFDVTTTSTIQCIRFLGNDALICGLLNGKIVTISIK